MAKIAVFAGTRPELIKLASVIWRLNEVKEELLFVHTGQHYDFNMSLQFVPELNLPQPQYSLEVGSSTHGAQTACVLERAEDVLRKEAPHFALVEGDTNSVLGVALASAKLRIPLGHVEAGCRSFDKSMPEEINRAVVADCATVNFAPTRKCVDNLRREGIDAASIFLTGHPIVDVIRKLESKIDSTNILDDLGFKRKDYALLTVHREENADNEKKLRSILNAIGEIDLPVVFPTHPRTKKSMENYGMSPSKNTIAIDPLGYFDTLNLIKNAKVTITDSGGIQQEACILKTPCITIREITEWTETVDAGVNVLVGADRSRIIAACARIMKSYDTFTRKFERTKDMFGRGDAARRIVQTIHSFLADK